MLDSMPQECFISHAYRDAAEVDLLLRSLPLEVQPYIFPPIKVRPDEMVSTHLIDAILEREGLIHLIAPHSLRSFWVSFERNYAKEASRRVFSFDADVGGPAGLKPDTEPPRTPIVYPSFARHDRATVHEILRRMEERSFDVFDETSVVEDFAQDLRGQMHQYLDRGGYVLLFWSAQAACSSFVCDHEIRWVREWGPGRLLIGILDHTPLPDWWRSLGCPHPVQLFGDEERPAMSRWDDLIVRLYWLAEHGKPEDERALDWEES